VSTAIPVALGLLGKERFDFIRLRRVKDATLTAPRHETPAAGIRTVA
jgi:hypothetical protein